MESVEKEGSGVWDSSQSLLTYASGMIDAQHCKTGMLSGCLLEWRILESSELVRTSHLMK